jgi:hypothetical protein
MDVMTVAQTSSGAAILASSTRQWNRSAGSPGIVILGKAVDPATAACCMIFQVARHQSKPLPATSADQLSIFMINQLSSFMRCQWFVIFSTTPAPFH